MEIKRSSWHYKISNLGGSETSDDNLCRYFWRGVFKLAVAFVLAGYVCFLLYAWFASSMVIPITIMVLFIPSLFVLPILAIYFLRKRLGKSPEMPYGNIVSEYVAARKRKVCPLIKYI